MMKSSQSCTRSNGRPCLYLQQLCSY
uniref:Uncharacterized protein n=1 Tax=Arundo donax TaxID=35708 RepID=A0A0A9EI61_ARUDO